MPALRLCVPVGTRRNVGCNQKEDTAPTPTPCLSQRSLLRAQEVCWRKWSVRLPGSAPRLPAGRSGHVKKWREGGVTTHNPESPASARFPCRGCRVLHGTRSGHTKPLTPGPPELSLMMCAQEQTPRTNS